MNDPRLSAEYRAALESYLQGGDEAALVKGYEIGRRTLNEGQGVLGIAAISHQALLEVLAARGTPAEQAKVLSAAQGLLAEALSPFEMAHRGFQEANLALRRLNETLEGEIKRIAHLLHGEAGQLLAAVHIALDDLARDLPPAERERTQQIREFLDRIE